MRGLGAALVLAAWRMPAHAQNAAPQPSTPPAAPAANQAAPAPATATPSAAPAPPAATTPAPSAPHAVARQVAVPAGTLLVVQMKTQVTSDDKAGMGFQSVLLGDLAVEGSVVAKAGTTVIGKVSESKRAGRLFGKSELAISLTQIIANSQLIAISTSNFSEAGTTSFRKTARNSGIGAGIGAAFDGGQGAAAGAAIGGAVSLIRKGESVTIPAGAVLEFRLTQPVVMPVVP